MATTTAADWQRAKQKVLSWMDHEERCVTTQRIAQTMNLSRLEASQLLQEILDEKKNFQVTLCRRDELVEDSIPVTVFRLRQSTTTNEDNHGVVALAPLTATESIATAHERDLLEWREMVADGRYKQPSHLAIEPADAVAEIKDTLAPRASKLVVEDESTAVAVSSNLSSNRHKAFSGKAKQVTTAASFFGSNNNNKSKTGGASDKKNSESDTTAPSNGKLTTSKTSSNTVHASYSSNNNSNNNNLKPPQPTRAKENKVRANQVAPEVEISTTKKAAANNSKQPKVCGNVDDFVGDEEESDDDEDEKVQKLQQKRAARRKAVQQANKQSEQDLLENNDEDEDDKIKVVGAMDAFATTAPKAVLAEPTTTSTTRQRKRRKKLVEETVMVNGYLRTETKAIWEDVPTDEEEEEREQERLRAAAKKPLKGNAAKSQQGMKQKSLMGFFAKK